MAPKLDNHGLFPRGFSHSTKWAWPLTLARQLLTLNYGKALTELTRRPGPIPVYGSNGQCGWHDAALREGPGVILGRKGQGPLGVEWCDSPFWVIDTAYFLTLNRRDIDLRFYYYLTKYIGLNHLKDGTSNPSLSRDTFGVQLFPVPPLPDQKAIAGFLADFDRKIHVNRRMNETLEAIASAIFKSWFLDFDPVRAKMEGRQPAAIDPEAAALFPDSLEDSPLGPIPAGWRACPLPTAIDVNPPRKLSNGAIAPYLDMQNMPTHSHRPDSWVDRPFGSGMRFTNGDTLVARITPCLENGKTAFVDFLEDGQVGWGSTEYIVLRPRNPLAPEHAYYLARTDDFRTFAIQNMTGTSGRQRVPAQSLDHYRIVVPTKNIAAAFGRLAHSVMNKIRANSQQNATLAALRDTLLPKLLSGEITIEAGRDGTES
jgi:type I restriction enzyme S subunit